MEYTGCGESFKKKFSPPKPLDACLIPQQNPSETQNLLVNMGHLSTTQYTRIFVKVGQRMLGNLLQLLL